ncbi:MAG: hypothetical protein M3O94_07110 [Actinomycetota bacterium]|nr:hypothetical protein [Actinomycetota bacterium]
MQISALLSTTTLDVGCGTADGSAWTWGTRSVQVTLTRLDGMQSGTLTAPAHKARSAGVAGR